jgi:hypothetical protein
MKPRPLHLPTVVASAVALLLLLPTGAAGYAPRTAAAPDPASGYLQKYPGGIRLNDNEVRYGALIVTVTRPATSAAATADCPAGWYCFYDGTNYGFPRGRLSSCGWQDLVPYSWANRVASAYYDMSSGRVTFYDRRTSDPGDDAALFTVSVATRGDPDTSPSRDKADYVYRTC